MSWKASRADAAFSGVRTISEPVEPDARPLPSCAARTKITLRCRHDERAFTFSLPAKGRTPWLSCDVPPQNRRSHVMADMATPVLQVVSSATHEGSMDTLILRADGPSECPPGTPSAVVITPDGGAPQSVRVPAKDWKLPLPSPLTGEVTAGEKPWEVPGVHPFCLPDLPARTWHLALAACPSEHAGMSVLLKAFPNVTWNGQARVQATSENGPARPVVEGGLTLRVDGRERTLRDWRSLKTIFPLLGMLDDLTRTVNAVAELTSPRHSRGLDSSRLQWREPFRWDPLPSLSVSVESRLFEQPGSGLLGHYLNIGITAEPLAGAAGEASVLPLLMTNAEAEKRLAPITGGRGGRVVELSTRYGIYLIAEGRCTLRAALRSVRPMENITQDFLTHGSVNFALEGRSESEFESLVVSSTAATSTSEGCTLAVALEAPPDSPLQEPRDRKPKVQTAFTGLHFHGIERVCGGVRIRPWQPPPPEDQEPAPPKPISLLPARMWPPGSEAGMPAEIPWCHE
jgi:hypothetical protein